MFNLILFYVILANITVAGLFIGPLNICNTSFIGQISNAFFKICVLGFPVELAGHVNAFILPKYLFVGLYK